MTSYPSTKLFIAGVWRDATRGRTIDVINPATEEVIGTVAHAGIDDLDEALEAARSGFDIWRRTPAFERYQIMRRAAGLMRERAEAIGPLLTMEQGKPLDQAIGEAAAAADMIDWFAEEGRRVTSKIIPARAAGITQVAVKKPVGPVAAFTPWNFPINQVVRKLSGALAAGCSIIVKAPEETPAAPAQLIQAFHDAGVPVGVVNLVFGVPAEISEYLIPHPVIRKVSFTGSTPVGKHLAALAGQHMKPVTMELGGHGPVVITKDADLENVTSLLAKTKIRNAGQICVSPTRFLVEDEVADQFAKDFATIVGQTKIGNGMEPGTEMGPLANDRRIPALEELIEDAVQSGAKLATGGRRIGNKGWFFEPTVLTDVPTAARVMNEEPFGPLAIINRFSTIDDAISEANRLPYGLAAYGFTGSNNTADRLSEDLEAGIVAVNHNGFGLPELPFGGTKDSGYGTEGGTEAIEAYLETRLVTRKEA
ncbi:NAD-dependent succinate-semialdehyde dehydrogenase [Qingshengfaniella alkalisoli]|uniref:NAD-dependent succinate-semialdehyde dehydrogenase n=1 Tax=Qingshengfaniella alkalisoli TaxID=2599296 RepID=A0A5B8J093_9RHOB|nr:NAD-dependent succinate-semialdehyde dehydrogenase [Qingshengfaniella alkalisoli]QDY71324.1 NAD-dependent succinate-semialdehyde dehydrogenase [Qingshengfaniella alkalisoli]